MNRYATSEACLIMPARVAALLEKVLKVDDARLRNRGQDVEVDQVLLAWRAVAAQFVDEVREQGRFRSGGSSVEPERKLADTWSSNEVAARTNRTSRAVRLAASQDRLVGERIDGRWKFTPEDVAHWVTRRKDAR